jgi:hypothetical protein
MLSPVATLADAGMFAVDAALFAAVDPLAPSPTGTGADADPARPTGAAMTVDVDQPLVSAGATAVLAAIPLAAPASSPAYGAPPSIGDLLLAGYPGNATVPGTPLPDAAPPGGRPSGDDLLLAGYSPNATVPVGGPPPSATGSPAAIPVASSRRRIRVARRPPGRRHRPLPRRRRRPNRPRHRACPVPPACHRNS